MSAVQVLSDVCQCGHWSRHHSVGTRESCGHCTCGGFSPEAPVLPVFTVRELILMADASDGIEDLAGRFDLEHAEMIARRRWLA